MKVHRLLGDLLNTCVLLMYLEVHCSDLLWDRDKFLIGPSSSPFQLSQLIECRRSAKMGRSLQTRNMSPVKPIRTAELTVK